MYYITFNNDEIPINKIEEIYKIQNPHNVRKLYLTNINFTSLPHNIFNELTQLQILTLSDNKLSSLPHNIFNELTQLQGLNLSFNNFTSLPHNIFNSLTQLQGLNLSNNNLTLLPENIFNSLTQLQRLHLSYNNFTSLPHNIFNSLTQLQELYCKKNPLSILPSLKNLSKIRRLQCNYSKIKNLPISIRHCKKINYYNTEFDIPDYKYINDLPYLVNKEIEKYYYKPVLDYYNSKYLK
jgi:Leucine-rich repeat (LRR) protein